MIKMVIDIFNLIEFVSRTELENMIKKMNILDN